jgi:glycine/D-amino acid oxidase-like deaminating enzyme
MAHQQPQNIVIIGGGIAGLSTAYYLIHHPTLKLHPDAKVTVVEGTGVASAASGYSGGFLAKDWHGSATASEQTLPNWDQADSIHKVSQR